MRTNAPASSVVAGRARPTSVRAMAGQCTAGCFVSEGTCPGCASLPLPLSSCRSFAAVSAELLFPSADSCLWLLWPVRRCTRWGPV